MRLACPRCRTSLEPAVEATPGGRVELDYCPSCRGVWFDAQELATLLCLGNRDAFSAATPLLGDGRVSFDCPRHPDVPMYARSLTAGPAVDGAGTAAIVLEQCPQCEGLWLDGGELRLVAAAVGSPGAQRLIAGAGSGSPFTWLFLLLTGLPIEQWHPRSRRPLTVLGLVIVCVLVFGWQISQLGEPSSLMDRLELVPSAILAATVPWTLLSYLFLHAGLGHLLGNLYFLWVFGDNVEDRLGPWPFLVVYFSAGIAAGLTHVLLTSDLDSPVVGASGAISGVLAAYALLFPRARLVSVFFFVRIRWRAATYLGLWFAIQILGALAGGAGIAWWAHVGGFVAGGLVALALRRSRQLPAPLPVAQGA